MFFAVGFETTAPANAMAVRQAKHLGIENFALLVAHVLVPPAIMAILVSPGNRVQGFLAPGHVCAIQGWREYEPIARDFGVPLVVTGFEPVDLLEGIRMLVAQLEEGRAEVENQYVRAVAREGNPAALAVVDEVFETCDRAWRGIGVIPESGLRLREAYASTTPSGSFPRDGGVPAERVGDLHRGRRPARPREAARLPGVRHALHAESPLGAPMVSSEGACAAYFLAGPAPRGGDGVSDGEEQEVREFALRCPVPLPPGDACSLGHGSGGKLTRS